MNGQGSWVSRWYRRLGLAVAVFLGISWGLGPARDVAADTVQGTGTGGACVTEWVLWGGSAEGLAWVAISYHVVMQGTPTVLDGGWYGSSGRWTQGWWSNGGGGSSELWLVGNSGDGQAKGLSATLQRGTTGTLSYRIRVPGYGVGSCVVIDQVRVSRAWDTNYEGITPPPGGGGPTVNPSPTAGPTQPAEPTPVPSEGPNDVCAQQFVLGERVCYPPPPSGWCYSDAFLLLGADPVFVACTVEPTPTPDAPGVYDDGCDDVDTSWTFVDLLEVSNTPNVNTDGLAAAFGTLEVGSKYKVLACFEWHGGTPSPDWGVRTEIIRGSGAGVVLWTDSRIDGASSNARVNSYTGLCTGSAWCPLTSTYTADFTVDVESTSITTSPRARVFFNGGSYVSTYKIWLYGKLVADAAGSPAPTATPASTPGPATVPPDYWGGGGATAPPVSVTFGPIDICPDPRPSPEIAACVEMGPAPTLGTYGPVSTWFEDRMGALASGLGQKVPFGYAVQVGDAITDATDPAYIGTDADACGSWSLDLPIWRPPGAGDSYVESQAVPCESFTALAVIRPVALGFLVIAWGLFMLRAISGAVGAGKGAD